MATFFEHIQFQARSRPGAPAILTARAVVTYEELVNRSSVVMRYLHEAGVQPGDIVALNLHEPVAHCCAIIGAMAMGVPTLSSPGNRPQFPKKLSVHTILSDQPALTGVGQTKILALPANWLKDAPAKGPALPIAAKPSDGIARIICTSGTTGEQKAVPFSESQLIDRVWGQIVGLRTLAGPSKTLGMMGLSSGAGFSNMMLVLMTGGTLLLVPGVAQLARVSNIYRMDRILASTAQLIAIVRQQESDSADFAGIRSMVVGGSHIPRSIAKRARAICRNIICLYGSTEVGVVATAPTELTIREQSAVGYLAPGVQVEIVDEGGNALGFGREGVIRVRVPNAPNRYLNDEDASQTVFRDGWFYPGDIGSLSEERLLFVSGRVSERINAGGVKVAPSVIEDVIGARPEIADVAAFEFVNAEGISEIAVAVVPHESLDRTNFNRAEFRQSFQKQLRERTPKRWFLVKEIPRSEQGKIDRARLKAMARRLALAA
jgi:acyl-CoA synthetase (AMP-forming)/AMP-acid ligase II